MSSGTEIGKKAKEYMDNGMLVPDEIVTDVYNLCLKSLFFFTLTHFLSSIYSNEDFLNNRW